MDKTTRWVAFAVAQLQARGRPASLDDIRQVIVSSADTQGTDISDAAIKSALLSLQHPSTATSRSTRRGQSVTCTPLPAGWIPADEFPKRR